MIRVFVDSGSSIKNDEKEIYNIELIPLKILIGDKEYEDGIDLNFEIFYDALINKKIFPKTSLPNLMELEKKVKKCLNDGDEVIILTISSGISSTYNTIKMLFEGEKRVTVIDSKLAVGAMRILVNEINRYRDTNVNFIVEKVNALIPKIRILAVPETLDYLHKGGRLSKMSYFVGSLLRIKPLITFEDGKVQVYSKERGLKAAIKMIVRELEKCDENYEIIPSYTYSKENLNLLIDKIDEKYKNLISVYDNLDPAIASHWGPNAFGFIYVEK